MNEMCNFVLNCNYQKDTSTEKLKQQYYRQTWSYQSTLLQNKKKQTQKILADSYKIRLAHTVSYCTSARNSKYDCLNVTYMLQEIGQGISLKPKPDIDCTSKKKINKSHLGILIEKS